MGNDNKQDKAPETDGSEKQVEKFAKRIVVLETENGTLKRLVAELGAEVKELTADVKSLIEERTSIRDRFEELEEMITKPGAGAIAAVAAAPAGKKGPKKDEVPEGFFRNARGLLVEEQYRGEKKYELSEPAFIGGTLRQAGDRITVIDEQPGKTWMPLVPKVTEQLVAVAPAQQKRAADTER